MTRDSLSGQNSSRRADGVGSSPALSKSKKTALWKRLRKYDRKIGEIDRYIWLFGAIDRKYISMETKRKKLDQKRKEVRMKLKGYN